MNSYTKQLQQELEGSSAMPYFEITVTQDGEPEWVTCEVFFKGNSIVAQREAVSSKEENSEYIAQTNISVDSLFGLQEHLEWLLEKIQREIIEGDLYTLEQ